MTVQIIKKCWTLTLLRSEAVCRNDKQLNILDHIRYSQREYPSLILMVKTAKKDFKLQASTLKHAVFQLGLGYVLLEPEVYHMVDLSLWRDTRRRILVRTDLRYRLTESCCHICQDTALPGPEV